MTFNTVTVACESMAAYRQHALTGEELATVEQALAILGRLLDPSGRQKLLSPACVRDLLLLRFAPMPVEVFGTVWLSSQHAVIEVEVLFRGTLTQTAVYPRELVKRAVQLDACAAILFHNHPSGSLEPSRADEFLTQTIKQALVLVDCRVLDHIIVAGGSTTSFAERGLI